MKDGDFFFLIIILEICILELLINCFRKEADPTYGFPIMPVLRHFF